jgi:two-component system chemotaxis sensor kinase CheA
MRAAGGAHVVQYRGGLMPLVPLDPAWRLPAAEAAEARVAVLVFSDGARSMGLIVDAILDVVEERLQVELDRERPGYLGSAVLAGRVTEVIDCAHWLARAGGGWFGRPAAAPAKPRLLVVEDSAFFRNMVVPALGSAGYDVTAVDHPPQALRLRDAGAMFDAIISDIEMPEMDGYGFAQAVRAGGPWASLPLVALSGCVAPADLARGRAAGFTDHVAKFDRAALLASLRDCLAPPVAADAVAEAPR